MSGTAGKPIVTSGLIMHYDAANSKSYNGAGNAWNDLRGNKLNGTLAKTAIGTTKSKVMTFTRGDTIDLPSSIVSELQGNPEASIECWCRVDNMYPVGSGIFQLSGYISGNGNLYPYNTFYKVYLDIFRTNRIGAIYTNTPVNELHLLTITTKPGTNGWNVYQNGELIKSVTGESMVHVNYRTPNLGSSAGSRYLIGIMASVRIYNKALTSTEVLKNYNASKARFGL